MEHSNRGQEYIDWLKKAVSLMICTRKRNTVQSSTDWAQVCAEDTSAMVYIHDITNLK